MADTYLSHHGVKGQKWGVRQCQNSGASKRRSKKVSTGSEKQRNGKKTTISKKAFNMFNKKIKDINSSTLNHGKTFATQQLLNQQLLNQQFTDWMVQESTRASINAANQAASLSISGGTNPFVFGMM